MNKAAIIQQTSDFVQQTLHGAEGGHDWWHIYRVWKTARQIAASENVDTLTVELGALLHDIADSKFHNGDETIGPRMAGNFLTSIGIPAETIIHVQKMIENISFKGGKEQQHFKSAELDVVQDADRLDALGAIGIARTFNYGGHKNREIYNPEIKPDMNMSKEAYKNSTAPSINHFYEKLLLLKDLMNTETGKKMAQQRHDFMILYLDTFYKEWEGQQ
ncbi:MAG: HD domain-containing protein [Lentimicrobiaceae bacterium]|nr:HD domain-containing protein [Lentimicrobiaceae bacterium]MCB9023591.1 HD domain-containing protein [Lentimicrobiaceae bacterium]MCO5264376.1 HD domain-containing protein [Lentimicrobium sp.]HPG33743.1 HD domain-containing protein [Lentimicrobium sp.]